MNKPIPFGKYYLLERINVGGMAEVFRAKQFGVEGFERLVAVKRILPNIAEDKEFIEMFVDEAKISVQLNHANIAQVFDLGHEEGSYYIALEHIHGRDLRAIFDRNRNQGTPMPVPQACFVIMKVCEGLDYAHNKRDEAGRELALVHRDVSPQNVIVSHEGEVKLIDFGIAKAAGRGSQTQAGILKGKFGYMSPEQVRGLPVDRRSDVFSCGIVLYELLTGERLFVGESDFSTLEKVRNVEILPPSTYNRKIQPELERIVLKALAKDVEDRYQNAIDLHDELQAFVYTSGEFYSRKDLAGWMKQLWSNEIKEESAKLASYRDMAPPVLAEQPSSGPPPLKNERKATASMGAQKPPPIPGKGGAKLRPGKMTTPMRPEGGAPQEAAASQGLEWDDDELETSIYDEETPVEEVEEIAPAFVPAASAPPSAPPAMAAKSGPTAPALSGSALSADTSATVDEPDLSSLVATSQGWDAPNPTPEMLAKSSDMGASPERVADGSNRTKAPAEPDLSGGVSEVLRMASIAAPSTTASAIAPKKNRTTLYALIAISLLIAGGIVAVLLMSTQEEKGEGEVAENGIGETTATKPVPGVGEEPETPVEVTPGTPVPTVTGIANADTGLDLIVNPPGVKVSLDGRPIGKAPLQIRSLRPGEHFIEIEAPPGFFSKSETVTVTQDKADRVEIDLVAMDIQGTFDSEPSGAEVILIADGVSTSLGDGPVTAKIDPHKNYEVVFKKDGYTTVTRPVEVTGDTALAVTGTLTKARTASRPTAPVPSSKPKAPTPVASIGPKPSDKPTAPVVDKPEPPKPEVKPKPPAVDANATGTLLLASKPPCSIFIDGRDTGKKTPQRNIKLPVGKHRITLLNNELGIKESFNVTISANKSSKMVKDYTSKIN